MSTINNIINSLYRHTSVLCTHKENSIYAMLSISHLLRLNNLNIITSVSDFTFSQWQFTAVFIFQSLRVKVEPDIVKPFSMMCISCLTCRPRPWTGDWHQYKCATTLGSCIWLNLCWIAASISDGNDACNSFIIKHSKQLT